VTAMRSYWLPTAETVRLVVAAFMRPSDRDDPMNRVTTNQVP